MSDPTLQPGRPPAGWLPPPLSGPAPWPGPPQPDSPLAPMLPPTGPAITPSPPTPRQRSPWTLLAVVVAVLGLIGLGIVVWRVATGTTPTPSTSAAAPTAPVQAQGGDLGTAVTLRGADGTATVTASAAIWTPEGELAPAHGTSYLIVDVELSGGSGKVTVGGIFTVAVAADGTRHGIAYGPELDPLLPTTVLDANDTASGQLGYQLPPGNVTIEFQDPAGAVLGTVAIPGP